MAKRLRTIDETYGALLDEFVERGCRIKELESELSALKHTQEEVAPQIKRLFETIGENSVPRPRGTVYLTRETVVRPAKTNDLACAALKREGLYRFTARRIVNEKDLARYIDEHGLAARFEDELEITELFHVRVRRTTNGK